MSKNKKMIDIDIMTELYSLRMLTKKYSKESELASYVYGSLNLLMKEIEKYEMAKGKN